MKLGISRNLARRQASLLSGVSRSRVAAAVALAAISTSAATANATTFSQCDFSDTSSLALNGSAAQDGTLLQLTTADIHEAGTAYYGTAVAWTATTSFHTSFQFQIGGVTGEAEGISFILQDMGSDALGSDSSGIGYGGIDSSMEIEFDTYMDSFDPDANHIALMMDGDQTTHLAYADPPFSMAGAGVLYAWIDYDAATTELDVYLSQTPTEPATPVLTVDLTIDATELFVGFTSSTGAVTESEQDILEWEFSTDGIPCTCGGDAECTTAAAPVCATTGPEEGLCVAAVSPPPDAGSPPPDAGSPHDAGHEAGVADSSAPLPDSGQPHDSGSPAPDAAPARPDSGQAPREAGTTLEDTDGSMGGSACAFAPRSATSTSAGPLLLALFGLIAGGWRRRRAAKH
jgi:hypothetical protein